MTGDRWQEVDELFRLALEHPPAERAALLTRECGDDAELRTAVEDLLEATEEADSFLEASVEDLCDLPWEEILPAPQPGSRPGEGDGAQFDRSGERVDAYRLVRRLGRGGMATVYLAERADGRWEQRVAVKILRRGLDTEDVVRRFRAERQILSSLDHPNIARLLDGGSTADGLPYLVMRYVEGTPITTYCDEQELPVEDRLALFCDVGRAVQAAHRHLIVHRDLKPSNILVNTEGRVKLLDFGIAKILDPSGQEEPTRTGLRPLTLAYASPEQVTGGAITTASDIYQLGLLLCELLTGRRPYEVKALSPARAERAITEAEPARPSSLVTEQTGALRFSGRAELARRLRGDLDTIVLHAVRKEPEERYDSAGALVDDVQRHLKGQPVTARPDTLAYRTRKFVGRHRAGVGMAALAGLLLAGSATLSLVQAERAERERDRARAEAAKAEEVTDFLVGLFQSPDPYAPADPERGRDISAAEALELGAERARAELADRPAIRGELLASVAEVFRHLGQDDRATPVAEDALEALRQEHGEESGEVASALRALALLAASRDDRDSARALFTRALGAATAAYGPDDPRLAPYHSSMGTFQFSNIGTLDSARIHQERAVTLYRSGDPPLTGELAEALYKLADTYRVIGTLDEARLALDEALPLSREAHGADHPHTAFVLVADASLLRAEDRHEEARAAYLEALDILERTLGKEHDFVLNTWNNYALMLGEIGDLEGAEEAHRRILEVRRRTLGEGHSLTAGSLQNLAVNLKQQGRYEEAARLLRRASAAFGSSLGPEHPRTAFPLLTLTEMRLERGDHRSAERSARRAIGILSAALPEGHWLTAVAECRLGNALAGQGHRSEARTLIEKALDTLEEQVAAARAHRVTECRAAREALAADH